VKAHPTLNNQYEIRSDEKQEKNKQISLEFPLWEHQSALRLKGVGLLLGDWSTT